MRPHVDMKSDTETSKRRAELPPPTGQLQHPAQQAEGTRSAVDGPLPTASTKAKAFLYDDVDEGRPQPKEGGSDRRQRRAPEAPQPLDFAYVDYADSDDGNNNGRGAEEEESIGAAPTSRSHVIAPRDGGTVGRGMGKKQRSWEQPTRAFSYSSSSSSSMLPPTTLPPHDPHDHKEFFTSSAASSACPIQLSASSAPIPFVVGKSPPAFLRFSPRQYPQPLPIPIPIPPPPIHLSPYDYHHQASSQGGDPPIFYSISSSPPTPTEAESANDITMNGDDAHLSAPAAATANDFTSTNTWTCTSIDVTATTTWTSSKGKERCRGKSKAKRGYNKERVKGSEEEEEEGEGEVVCKGSSRRKLDQNTLKVKSHRHADNRKKKITELVAIGRWRGTPTAACPYAVTTCTPTTSTLALVADRDLLPRYPQQTIMVATEETQTRAGAAVALLTSITPTMNKHGIGHNVTLDSATANMNSASGKEYRRPGEVLLSSFSTSSFSSSSSREHAVLFLTTNERKRDEELNETETHQGEEMLLAHRKSPEPTVAWATAPSANTEEDPILVLGNEINDQKEENRPSHPAHSSSPSPSPTLTTISNVSELSLPPTPSKGVSNSNPPAQQRLPPCRTYDISNFTINGRAIFPLASADRRNGTNNNNNNNNNPLNGTRDDTLAPDDDEPKSGGDDDKCFSPCSKDVQENICTPPALSPSHRRVESHRAESAVEERGGEDNGLLAGDTCASTHNRLQEGDKNRSDERPSSESSLVGPHHLFRGSMEEFIRFIAFSGGRPRARQSQQQHHLLHRGGGGGGEPRGGFSFHVDHGAVDHHLRGRGEQRGLDYDESQLEEEQEEERLSRTAVQTSTTTTMATVCSTHGQTPSSPYNSSYLSRRQRTPSSDATTFTAASHSRSPAAPRRDSSEAATTTPPTTTTATRKESSSNETPSIRPVRSSGVHDPPPSRSGSLLFTANESNPTLLCLIIVESGEEEKATKRETATGGDEHVERGREGGEGRLPRICGHEVKEEGNGQQQQQQQQRIRRRETSEGGGGTSAEGSSSGNRTADSSPPPRPLLLSDTFFEDMFKTSLPERELRHPATAVNVEEPPLDHVVADDDADYDYVFSYSSSLSHSNTVRRPPTTSAAINTRTDPIALAAEALVAQLCDNSD